MANILLVWEMGTDLGHITRLDALARYLCEQGHAVTAIFSDLQEIQRIYSHQKAPAYRILQGPSWKDRRLKLSRPPASLTEVLLSVGFYKPQIIAEKLLQWKTLFSELQADVALFDYAPTAQLATREYAWHTINLGDPFSTPPTCSPLPLFNLNATISETNLMISDRRLVESVNQALAEAKLAKIQHAYELFSADQAFLLSIPELDPFAQFRTHEQYIASLPITNPTSRQLNWRDDTRKKVFGYLKPAYPQLKTLLKTASELPIQGRFFIPSAPIEILEQYQNSNLEIATTPYDINRGLAQCDLVVSHGGHSTLLYSALSGIPSLLIPLQQEQLSVTQRAVASGLALWLGNGVSDTNRIKVLFEMAFNDASFRRNTDNCAKRHHPSFTRSMLETIADYVESRP